MVGEDRCAFVAVGGIAVRDAGLGLDPVHDLPVPVRVEDGHDVLEDGRAALEPEAGVDVLLWKRRQRPVGVQLERHEDEVPELEEPGAARARGRAVGLAAAVLFAPVPVDLGVGPARVRAPRPTRSSPTRRERNDPLPRHPDLQPELDGDLVGAEPELRVAREDSDPDAIPVELHALLHELAREFDGALLEVLPEREVPEHLEERQVVAVEPDLVDVHGAEALLRGGREGAGGGSRPRKKGICGCMPAVVSRLESSSARGTSDADGHAQVAPLLEEREEALAQLGSRAHPESVGAAGGRGYAAGGGASGSAGPALAQLLVELVLPLGSRVLRHAHRLARILASANAAKPCDTPAGEPATTFLTGAVIAVETARTAVSALSAIDTALSVTTSSLSSWSLTRSTVPPVFTITGNRSRSVPG